jgi:hypothetical protein
MEMAYVLIRFFHSSEDPIEGVSDSPQASSPKYTGYTDSARTLAAELQKKAAELPKDISVSVILDATSKEENIFEVTFIQPLYTIKGTKDASSPALFERAQYSRQDEDTPLSRGIKNLPNVDLGGELDNLKGSDGTFDLVYMKEIYDGKDKDSAGQEKGKPKSEDITELVNEIANLLKSWG